MKKSKIIVPALGILAFSTAAAVTGTVAWFTANRLATVKNDQITVVNPEEGLILYKVVKVANTKVTGVNGSGVPDTPNLASVTHANDGTNQGVLRDASVDLSGSTVAAYKSILNESTGVRTGFEALDALTDKDTKKFDGKDIYYLTAFTASFKVNRVDTAHDASLFLDVANSTITEPNYATAGKASKALRFGFKTADQWFVWAPLTEDDTVKYVHKDGENAPAETALTTGQFVKGTTTTSSLDDSSGPMAKATATAYPEYLGILKDDADLDVTIYTWFEGSDSNCVNEQFKVSAAFTADLKFVSRKVTK